MAVTKEFLSSKLLQLIAVMSESLFVGSYFILVIMVCGILVARYRGMSAMLRTLFGASIVMFIISAVHLGLVIQELSTKAPPENRQAQIILSMFQFFIGELVLLWRLWIVWERSYWVIICPALLMVSAAGLILNLLSLPNVFFSVVPVVLIVANSTLCTSLIAGRIWYVRWQARSTARVSSLHGGSWWRGAAALIIESGVFYTAIQILSLLLHYRESVAVPVLLDTQVPIIGILPTLIIVLIHNDLPEKTTPASHPSSTASSRMEKYDLENGGLDYHYSLRSESKAGHYHRHSAAISFAS